jgi:L-aminopeptidase/D-esterase-like protein
MRCFISFPLFLVLASVAGTQPKPRARDLGVVFEGTHGPLNAITDVTGVEVGNTTLISGAGALHVGQGPVRTGVTAILPRGKEGAADPVFGGWIAQNGNGEMTGTTWIEESGFLEGPVMITNTHSVGVVRDAVIAWEVKHNAKFQAWSMPVVAETYDGYLNDADGFHVKAEHAWAALDGAKPGHVPEGNVGGGTGMICFGFKGGIGTASRHLSADQGGYTVGVLVQCNTGARKLLRVSGELIGPELSESVPKVASSLPGAGGSEAERGSIIIVVATDAPVLPHQLKRIARRATMGLARCGAISSNSSGDIFIAFSTANRNAAGERHELAGINQPSPKTRVEMMHNDALTALFEATVQATEEGIVNALIAAEDMRGADDHFVPALPHEALRQVLRQHGRLAQ